MANVWVSIPLDQLITRPPDVPGRRSARCTLCGAATPAAIEDTADSQIQTHLQRDHGAIIEEPTAKASARVRRALQARGWTPPTDDPPTDAPGRREHPPPARAQQR